MAGFRLGTDRSCLALTGHNRSRAAMPFGRLIRVSRLGDPRTAAYIVAVPDPDRAVDLIRKQVAAPDDEIKDFGRVSNELLEALNLMPDQFVRADSRRRRGNDR